MVQKLGRNNCSVPARCASLKSRHMLIHKGHYPENIVRNIFCDENGYYWSETQRKHLRMNINRC